MNGILNEKKYRVTLRSHSDTNNDQMLHLTYTELQAFKFDPSIYSIVVSLI